MLALETHLQASLLQQLRVQQRLLRPQQQVPMQQALGAVACRAAALMGWWLFSLPAALAAASPAVWPQCRRQWGCQRQQQGSQLVASWQLRPARRPPRL